MSMKRKWGAIGILLLFSFVSVTGAGTVVQKDTVLPTGTPEIEHIPGDGLYWNDQKIAAYQVPLYLHYYFKWKAFFHPRFVFHNISSIYKIEFYLDGALVGESMDPPWEFYWDIGIPPFGHSSTCGIKIYFEDQQTLRDNVTIYRLFP